MGGREGETGHLMGLDQASKEKKNSKGKEIKAEEKVNYYKKKIQKKHQATS